MHVWWKKNDHVDAGEIAQGKVDDALDAASPRRGPARRSRGRWPAATTGAFGGKKINSLSVWLAFCAVFLLGLRDFRRPLSLRNLDLLALLSFSVSLWYFNHGNIFTSVPLAYPPLAYLLARCVWIGVRGTPVRAARPIWKPAMLLAAAVFLIGFRIGLNRRGLERDRRRLRRRDRRGADRAPVSCRTTTFPKEDDLKACGPADSSGEIRDRIQFNGRCESANPLGDTYGPVAYEAYLPGYWIRGWSGKWDKLPAVHLTSIIFDVLCALGLGPRRLALRRSLARCCARVRVGGVPVHAVRRRCRTRTTRSCRCSSSSGFWLASSPLGARGRGGALGLDEVRDARRRADVAHVSGTDPVAPPRPALVFAAGFLVATVAGLLGAAARRPSDPGGTDLLRPDAEDADHAASRRSRSGTGRSTTHAGFPTSTSSSGCSKGCSWSVQSPRHSSRGSKTPLQLAALDRCAPDRLRARADALVLPLHPVVLPLRRVRPALAHGREQPEPGI